MTSSSEAEGGEFFFRSLWPSPNSRCCPCEFCKLWKWKKEENIWDTLYITHHLMAWHDTLLTFEEGGRNVLNDLGYYRSSCILVLKWCISVYFRVRVPLYEAERGSLSCLQSSSHCHSDLRTGRQCVALCTPASRRHLSAMRREQEWDEPGASFTYIKRWQLSRRVM